MKKTLLTLSAFLLFISVPAFSQTAQEEANEIKSASEEAVQSESATESRSEETAAWDKAEEGSGTPNVADVGNVETIDIIGGDEGNEPKEDEETSFETPKTEDVTPWKGTITGIVASFMSGLGLMLIAATLLASIISDEVTYSRYIITRIAQALFVAAAAAFATAIAFATILMVEYKQYMLGSIWAGIATFSLAEAIYMTYKCQSPASSYDPRLSSGMKLSDNFHKALKTAAILAFVMGGISAAAGGPMTWYSYKKANNNATVSENSKSQQNDNKVASDESNQTQQVDENQDQQLPAEITE